MRDTISITTEVDIDLDDVMSDDDAQGYIAEMHLESIMDHAGEENCREVFEDNDWGLPQQGDNLSKPDEVAKAVNSHMTHREKIQFLITMVRLLGDSDFAKAAMNALAEDMLQHEDIIQMTKNLGLKVFKEM